MTDHPTDASPRYLPSYINACRTVIETILNSLDREDSKRVLANLKELYVV